jgi:hypothetical protein
MIEKYKNLSRNAGVIHFQIGENFIELRFNNAGFVYKYTNKDPGTSYVSEMKKLAKLGKGLTKYRNIKVKSFYSKKSSWTNIM